MFIRVVFLSRLSSFGMLRTRTCFSVSTLVCCHGDWCRDFPYPWRQRKAWYKNWRFVALSWISMNLHMHVYMKLRSWYENSLSPPPPPSLLPSSMLVAMSTLLVSSEWLWTLSSAQTVWLSSKSSSRRRGTPYQSASQRWCCSLPLGPSCRHQLPYCCLMFSQVLSKRWIRWK